MILQSNEIRIPIYIKNKPETTPIDVVQYLNSFYMYFEIKDFDIPENSTAKFYLRKTSGKEIYQDLEIQGKQLVLIPTNQTFAETGVQNAQISITNGENIATSFSIQFSVHKNLVSLEATKSRNEATIISQLEQFLIKPTVQGDNITLKDSSNYYINGIKLFGKSTQEGTPTPDVPVEIQTIKNKIDLIVSNTLKLNQTATIPLSQDLNGIKVGSNSNYTDDNNQKFISDYIFIDLINKTGYLIKKTEKITLPKQNWIEQTDETDFIELRQTITNMKPGATLKTMSNFFGYTETNRISVLGQNLYVRIPKSSGIDDYEKAKQFLAKNDIILFYQLKTEEKINLTRQQINEFLNLKTYYPNTNISTLESAGVEISYFADVKNYVDEEVKKAVDNITQILSNTLSTLPLEIQSKMIENDINNKFKGAVN